MLWLDDFVKADSLPAVWLIATGEAPATRPERSRLRHGVTRRIIAAQTGMAAGQVALSHDRAGRLLPFRCGDGVIHACHATRTGFVAVALAHEGVGVDVECVSDGPIPMLALHLDEQAWLRSLPENGRARAFAQLWAAKEAHGKWLGAGVPQPDAFAVLPRDGGGWAAAAAPASAITVRLFARDGLDLAVAVAR